jgi:hypothetical protein
MLEPYDGKLSSTVLRGLGAENSPRLPDPKPISISAWSKHAMKAIITAIVMAIVVLAANRLSYADDIRIICNEEPPTNFRAADGTVTGFTTEIVREIQKRVGNNSDIKIYPWKRAYEIALKEPGIVLFTASRNPDREDRFHWIIQVTTRRSVFGARPTHC